MKVYGRTGVKLQVFLTSAARRGEWSFSRSRPLYFWGKSRITNWRSGWPQVDLDARKNILNLVPAGNQKNPWHVHTVAYSRYLLRHHSGSMLTSFFRINLLAPQHWKRDDRFIVATTGPFILDTVYFAVM